MGHLFTKVLVCATVLLGCVRCLLITESPKNPRSLQVPSVGPRLHPLYGIGGVQFAISGVPVYTAVSNF